MRIQVEPALPAVSAPGAAALWPMTAVRKAVEEPFSELARALSVAVDRWEQLEQQKREIQAINVAIQAADELNQIQQEELTRQGADALDATQRYTERATEIRSKYVDQIEDPLLRARAELHLANVIGPTRLRIALHEATERRKAAVETSAAWMATVGSQIAGLPESEFDGALPGVIETMRNILPGPEGATLAQKAASELIRRRAELLILGGQTLDGEAFVQKYGQYLDAADLSHIRTLSKASKDPDAEYIRVMKIVENTVPRDIQSQIALLGNSEFLEKNGIPPSVANHVKSQLKADYAFRKSLEDDTRREYERAQADQALQAIGRCGTPEQFEETKRRIFGLDLAPSEKRALLNMLDERERGLFRLKTAEQEVATYNKFADEVIAGVYRSERDLQESLIRSGLKETLASNILALYRNMYNTPGMNYYAEAANYLKQFYKAEEGATEGAQRAGKLTLVIVEEARKRGWSANSPEILRFAHSLTDVDTKTGERYGVIAEKHGVYIPLEEVPLETQMRIVRELESRDIPVTEYNIRRVLKENIARRNEAQQKQAETKQRPGKRVGAEMVIKKAPPEMGLP